MECPKCKTKGFYKEEKRTRKRDGAVCVYGICRAKGCGYGKLISAVLPEAIKMDNKKQLLFQF